MVEHSLCMRGAGGSIPPTSIVLFVFSYLGWHPLLSTHHQRSKVAWDQRANISHDRQSVGGLVSHVVIGVGKSVVSCLV